MGFNENRYFCYMRLIILFCGTLLSTVLLGQFRPAMFVGFEVAENEDLLLANRSGDFYRYPASGEAPMITRMFSRVVQFSIGKNLVCNGDTLVYVTQLFSRGGSALGRMSTASGFVSEDGGENWRAFNDDKFTYHDQIVYWRQSDNRLFWQSDKMLLSSDDNGKKWDGEKSHEANKPLTAVSLEAGKTVLQANVNAHLFRSDDGGMRYERIPSPEEQGVFVAELNDGLLNIISRVVSAGDELFVMQGFLWYRSKADNIEWKLLPALKDVAYSKTDQMVCFAYDNQLEVRSSINDSLVADFSGLPTIEWGATRFRNNKVYVVERNGKLYVFDPTTTSVESCMLRDEARLMELVPLDEETPTLLSEQAQTAAKNELLKERLAAFDADSITQIRFTSSYRGCYSRGSDAVLYKRQGDKLLKAPSDTTQRPGEIPQETIDVLIAGLRVGASPLTEPYPFTTSLDTTELLRLLSGGGAHRRIGLKSFRHEYQFSKSEERFLIDLVERPNLISAELAGQLSGPDPHTTSTYNSYMYIDLMNANGKELRLSYTNYRQGSKIRFWTIDEYGRKLTIHHQAPNNLFETYYGATDLLDDHVVFLRVGHALYVKTLKEKFSR